MSLSERSFCVSTGAAAHRADRGRRPAPEDAKTVSETLATVAALLDRLAPTADVSLAYSALADACVLVLAQESSVEIIKEGAAPYRVVSHEDASYSTALGGGADGTGLTDPLVVGSTTRRLLQTGRSFLITPESVTVAIADVGGPGPDYFGALVCTRRGGPAYSLLDAQVLRLAVERTIASIRREQVQQQRLLEAQGRAAELARTLEGSRELGMAVGIVMTRTGCMPDEAADRLRSISLHTNRPVGEVAAEVVRTGHIDIAGTPTRPQWVNRRPTQPAAY